jgi:hypothetical protein
MWKARKYRSREIPAKNDEFVKHINYYLFFAHFCHIKESLLCSYFNIVRSIVLDHVPKKITYFLIEHLKVRDAFCNFPTTVDYGCRFVGQFARRSFRRVVQTRHAKGSAHWKCLNRWWAWTCPGYARGLFFDIKIRVLKIVCFQILEDARKTLDELFDYENAVDQLSAVSNGNWFKTSFIWSKIQSNELCHSMAFDCC